MKLDAKTVATLALGSKTDVIHFDSELKGFGHRLRRAADGRVMRSWVVQYRRAGATRRVLLGSAAVLGAEAARAMAKKLLARIALGEDPQADKAERRGKDRVSLKTLIAEYLLAKQSRVRVRTMEDVTRYLAGDYFKPLHGMPVDQITRRDVAATLVVITREHSSIVAARARAALSAFFVWAMQSGLVESNPVIGTLRPAEGKPRERVLSDAELKAIWQACDDSEYGRIIRLLILLAARRNEVGGMAWGEFDFELKTWTLPANRSKNGRPLVLPLMPMALAIITAVPRMATRDQLFGQRGGGFTAWSRGKAALDQRSGVQNWTTHDLRRSVATHMADLGVAPHIIETILNHYAGHRAGPAGIYNRSNYPREVAAALMLWQNHIRALVAVGERKILAYAAAESS